MTSHFLENPLSPVPAAQAIMSQAAATFILAVMSTKGGVGKTTLAANIGALLADLGSRVLLIDADTQPSLSKYFELAHTAPYGLTQVLHRKMITSDEISSTVIPRLDIIVSDDAEKSLQGWLANKLDRGTRLKIALQSPLVRSDYDFVVIDTQGAAGPLQEAAALAADLMVSPITPDVLSAREFLEGTMELLGRLADGAAMGATPGQMRAVIYRQQRLKDSHQIARLVREQFLQLHGRVTILDGVVPSSKQFPEAATQCLPVHRADASWRESSLDVDGRINTVGSGSTIMHRLLWELIPSLDGRRVVREEVASHV